MSWPPEPPCANCGWPLLWRDDPEADGYHCRHCDEWYYPEQEAPDE